MKIISVVDYNIDPNSNPSSGKADGNLICLSSSKEVRINLTKARYRIDEYAKTLKRLGRAEA